LVPTFFDPQRALWKRAQERTESTVTVHFEAGPSDGDGDNEGVELGGVGFEVAGGRGRARVPDDPLSIDQFMVRGLVDRIRPVDDLLQRHCL